MKFCIQDPSYENSMYLHETLLTECESGLSGVGVYAFATKDGIELLLSDDSFRHFIENGFFYLVVGMDDITNVHSLEALKKLKGRYGDHLTVKAYLHNNRGSTFHPKFSWFKKKDSGVLILGSGNLTQKGLRHNREAYSVIDYNATDFQRVVDEWDRWITHSAPFLFNIDDDLVMQRAMQNAENINAVYQAKKSTEKSTLSDSGSALSELYNIQPKDNLTKVKHKTREKTVLEPQKNKQAKMDEEKPQTVIITDEDFDEDSNYWRIDETSELLIAEIPKSGNRWKQANFDKETFESYFGATCGENGAYRILLKSVNDDGTLNETEVRPSVSVSSRNYRFELDAATGIDYPTGDDRPLGIFAKVSCRDFIYELLMPDQQGYNDVIKVLNAKQIPTQKMRRVQFAVVEIYKKAPLLAIWKRFDENGDKD